MSDSRDVVWAPQPPITFVRWTTLETETYDRVKALLEKIASFDDDAMRHAQTLHWDMRGWAREALEALAYDDR